MQSGSDRPSGTPAGQRAGALPGEPPAGGRRRSWLGLLLVASVVVAGVEISVRAVDSRLPEVLEWQSVEAQRKVQQMDALARDGGVDVAIVGSSLASGDIDPAVLVEALGDVTAYNAGLSAGVPVLVEPWTTEVVLPRLRPSVLLVGVSSFDFFDHPTAGEFEAAFTTSPAGARHLGQVSLLQRIDHAIAGRSALWRHRRALRDPSILVDVVRGEVEALEPEFGPIDGSGRALYPDAAPDDGHAVGPPVGDWDIGERNPAALLRLIEQARAVGTAVILVDLPVSDHYVARHPGGEADQERFRAALRDLAQATGAGLVELGGLRDPELFVDQVHLTRAAGELVTELLAARLDALLPSLGSRQPSTHLAEGERPQRGEADAGEATSGEVGPGEGRGALDQRSASLERLADLVRDTRAAVEQPAEPAPAPDAPAPVVPDAILDLPPVTAPEAPVTPGLDQVPTTLP